MGAGCSSDKAASAQAYADAPQPKLDEGNASTSGKTDGAEAGVETTVPQEVKAGAGSCDRKLTILHFNDVYNIEEQEREPKGGASRLCSKVKEYRARGVNPLVLFSGDAYNPSLMSCITLGKQMVDVLNEIGVDVSCIGNHDFDYGLENLVKLNHQCKFPWLMANVVERGTDTPFGNALSTWMEDWSGIKVGVVGLVEEEWLDTLGAVNVDDMEYRDFIEVGRKAAQELKAEGAELLIALTHMREPNDRKLAAELPEFHLILGGHDHHYVSDFIQPHNNLLVKSGTDFRDLSVVEVVFPGGSPTPQLSVERVPIDSSVPEDPAMTEIVATHMKVMGEKMDEEIGETLEPLDGRFQTVRTRESNLGNFVADVWRKAAKADIVIANGGGLRSDMIHPVGPLKSKDLAAILPILCETLVLECTGAQVIRALENGVSQWPKLEGRFPQVSGLKFSFDPDQEPGQRVVPGSVMLTERGQGPEPIGLESRYRVAVTDYLAKGKDGFEVFTECKTLVDGESGVAVQSAIKYHFMQMQVANKFDSVSTILMPAANKWRRVKDTAKMDSAGKEELERKQAEQAKRLFEQAQKNTHGLSVPHPQHHHLCIAPRVEGRIVNIREEAERPADAAGS